MGIIGIMNKLKYWLGERLQNTLRRSLDGKTGSTPPLKSEEKPSACCHTADKWEIGFPKKEIPDFPKNREEIGFPKKEIYDFFRNPISLEIQFSPLLSARRALKSG